VDVWQALDEASACGCEAAIWIPGERADDLRAHLDTAERLFQEADRTERLSIVDAYRGAVEFLAGRSGQADEHLRRAVQRAESDDYAWGKIEGLLMLARLQVFEHAGEAALKTLNRAEQVTQSADEPAIANRYRPEVARLRARVQHERGHYGRAVTALWNLRQMDAVASARHFRVAEASTVPLVPTTGGFVFATLLLSAIGLMVSRKVGPALADRIFLSTDTAPPSRLYSGIPFFGNGETGDEDGDDETYHSTGSYRLPAGTPAGQGEDALRRYDVPEHEPFRTAVLHLKQKLYPNVDVSHDGLAESLEVVQRTPSNARTEAVEPGRVRLTCDLTGQPFVVAERAAVPHLRVTFPFPTPTGTVGENRLFIVHPYLVEQGPAYVLDALAWHVRTVYQEHATDLIDALRWHDALGDIELPLDDWPTRDDLPPYDSSAFRLGNGGDEGTET
jgi:tetratricopeptide (TPR) repeat protein